jgi:ribosomal protein S18 acetylase RimI-like enzyme
MRRRHPSAPRSLLPRRPAPGSVYPLGVATVRRATVQDAPALGRLHVRAWQAAYRGQMPDDYLDGLRPEERAVGWVRGLSRDRDQDPVLVAQQDDRVVGFAVVGPAQDPEGAGELYAINVDPDHWGREPVGPLLGAAEAELARLGYEQAVLLVLPGNPVRAGSTRSRAGPPTEPSAPPRSWASWFPKFATNGDYRVCLARLDRQSSLVTARRPARVCEFG